MFSGPPYPIQEFWTTFRCSRLCPQQCFLDRGPPQPLGGPRVEAILTRRPPAALNLYFEEMCLSLFIHRVMRGTQNCSWLKVGAIGETCAKRCMGSFVSYIVTECAVVAFYQNHVENAGEPHSPSCSYVLLVVL